MDVRDLLIGIVHCLGSCMVDDELLRGRWHILLHVLRGLLLIWDLRLGLRNISWLWDKWISLWR